MAATTAMFIATGADTLGQIQQQRQQARALKAQGAYERRVFDQNAQVADWQAADAVRRGEVEAAERGLMTRQRIGTQRAVMAAQGLDLSVGTALELPNNEERLGALDIATIRNNAAREAWGYDVQAQDFRRRGQIAEISSDAAALGLQAQMGSTLLTGAGKAYGLWRTRSDGGTTGRRRTSGMTPLRTGVDTVPMPVGREFA